MNKAWKIIAAIVIIALIFGALCVLVGSITGGDTQRIMDEFEKSYNLDGMFKTMRQAIINASETPAV